ncbi:MAG: ATP-binding cassette domain-containing protein [Dehalococcoidales bacterium]|nr:MAG: ATP-binding cassette domain-containing protein [Dehalococcoidales bacterium]
MDNGNNIIEIQDLTKKFGQITAVDSISFNVYKGEIFGFLGPNGAGKTTTINMLCTLMTPSGGRATVDGYDTLKQPRKVQQIIGLVFQDPTLDDYLTAEQNLRFHAYAYGVPKNVREKRLDQLLELVELSDRRKSKVSTYSGGMKRRLEIARGLLHHPQILFLDEPTLGLDPQTRYYVWEHIHALRKQEDLTIFMTTHYMDEAENCDRIAVIDQGKIVALDTPDNLKDSLGGDVVILEAEDSQKAILELEEKYNLSPQFQDNTITFSVPRGETFLPEFMRSFQSKLISINVHRPTLDDVFLKLTGRAIRDQEADSWTQFRRMMPH